MGYYAVTESGYNMYDILSCMQKSIRRGIYNLAAFSANELRIKFRKVMWNRLFVISSEDCFGILSKELYELYMRDTEKKDSRHIGNAVALLCKALKSRDACYFSCNFILASRNPREIPIAEQEISDFCASIKASNEAAFQSLNEVKQFDMFGFANIETGEYKESELQFLSDEDLVKAQTGLRLQKAIQHRDMDEIGYHMDLLRHKQRAFLWDVLVDYARRYTDKVLQEVIALSKIDEVVNGTKKEKDEIFISKAAILLCHSQDSRFETVKACPFIDYEKPIEWGWVETKPIGECKYSGELPEYVYDCHTLRGKRMGKTDWEMTVTEQAALYKLQEAYFDNASWIYTYEQDYENGVLDDKGMEPIRKFAETHEVNPVAFIPY